MNIIEGNLIFLGLLKKQFRFNSQSNDTSSTSTTRFSLLLPLFICRSSCTNEKLNFLLLLSFPHEPIFRFPKRSQLLLQSTLPPFPFLFSIHGHLLKSGTIDIHQTPPWTRTRTRTSLTLTVFFTVLSNTSNSVLVKVTPLYLLQSLLKTLIFW